MTHTASNPAREQTGGLGHTRLSGRRAWQHVQNAQAAMLDAMRTLDELRGVMPRSTYEDCERVLDDAYRTASRAQGYLLIAERNAIRGPDGRSGE